MSLVIVAVCILLLILLITWANWNPFLAFLVICLAGGWWLGMPLSQITLSIKKGIGDMLGELVILISLGAMLGKLVADSGAAQKIAQVLLQTFGKKYFQWALMVTGFIIGIPLFYNVGFVLMIPLIFSVVYETRLPAVYVGVPLLAALSVTHGFLPPHPSPTALVTQFDANLGVTLLYGLVIAIPAVVVAGPLFARTLKNIHSVPLSTFTPKEITPDQLPGSANSIFTSLLPVLLLVITTSLPFLFPSLQNRPWLQLISDPIVVMLAALLLATYTLGIHRGKTMKALMISYGESVKDIALIFLIVAGAGALKQLLIDSGVSREIGHSLQSLSLNPLVLGWLIAAIIRVCLGSATVAGLTAAGIVAPVVMANPQIDRNLMVLSIGAGSLMFSHVNDSGFWLFKEYFNLSIKQTIRSWSLMETLVSGMGLIGVLILQFILSK
jgi:Gnt-I system high-affinity gluconate transporter